MYLFISPCVLQPGLRARGITRQSDLDLFSRAVDRCRRYGIGTELLPCPETCYLGRDREPGTFSERLDTPEFARILDRLVREVEATMREKGAPLCMVGVNSSPTCGVDTTYFGSAANPPPKREGRGVFLARFPDVPAVDVGWFAKSRIYLAAPLFSGAERAYNQHLADELRSRFYEVYLPQTAGDDTADRDQDEHRRIFGKNLEALKSADIIVAVVDGADPDSGTAWEMGYAWAMGIPVIALRTDFRIAGLNEAVNLMLEQSSTVVNSPEALYRVLLTGPGVQGSKGHS